MSEQIIQTLKLKLVAAELAKIGITDRAQVVAIASRTTVSDTGAIIGLDAHGNRGVGSAPDYELTIADVAKDMGVITKASETAAAPTGVILDPKHPKFSYTAACLAARSDPAAHAVLMDHLDYMHGLGRN